MMRENLRIMLICSEEVFTQLYEKPESEKFDSTISDMPMQVCYTKSPSFVYLCWLLLILLDALKCTPASIPRRRLNLLLNATWY